ncbi:MAG: ROK family protein [Nitrospinae bacterium]|nr:ROK family protein [Nitrospinota bacterium]
MPGSEVYVGFDLGGSFLKASSFSLDGELAERRSIDSQWCLRPQDYLDLFKDAAKSLSSDKHLKGIGTAVAGVLDPEAGVIVDSPNLPALSGVPLLEMLKDSFAPIPLQMMNDANAAALGEYFAGAGVEHESMFIITLGTGVGGGFVVDGEIWSGASGMAGEIGHMVIEKNGKPCTCGSRGCLEAYFSGWALERDAKAHAQQYPDSAIGSLDIISPISLSELASSGDDEARTILENGGYALGAGIANIMNLLNPESIVLVGGLVNAKEHFLSFAQMAWEENSFDQASSSSKVFVGKLGEWAGVRGAIQPFLSE